MLPICGNFKVKKMQRIKLCNFWKMSPATNKTWNNAFNSKSLFKSWELSGSKNTWFWKLPIKKKYFSNQNGKIFHIYWPCNSFVLFSSLFQIWENLFEELSVFRVFGSEIQIISESRIHQTCYFILIYAVAVSVRFIHSCMIQKLAYLLAQPFTIFFIKNHGDLN